ncbi:MAG: tRNA uridine-5-carboxymethylaminomethyl(34) synthesis GTPase MnmE, partial [Clostridiales bacterium]
MINSQFDDTIAAIATPLGKGGIGIVRISGVAAVAILKRLLAPKADVADRRSHQLYLRDIYSPEAVFLDRGFTVWMQAPASYTGEDVVELQCHGGPKVMGQILRAVLAAGARLATPGEFTLRAFLNGKLDLAQAEAVADLIEAKTSKAAGLAAGQLQGRLSSYINNLAAEITDLLAQIMVGVDFPDDEDAPSSQFILTVMRDL